MIVIIMLDAIIILYCPLNSQITSLIHLILYYT